MRYIFGTAGYLNEVLYRLGVIELPSTGQEPLAGCGHGGRGRHLEGHAAGHAHPARRPAGHSPALYEAARTDGATPWQQFLGITLPLLRPAITMALIVRGVDAFRIFALPLALTGRNLPVLSTYAYVEYLEYGNPNTAAASSMLLLLMIVVVVAAYLRFADARRCCGEGPATPFLLVMILFAAARSMAAEGFREPAGPR